MLNIGIVLKFSITILILAGLKNIHSQNHFRVQINREVYGNLLKIIEVSISPYFSIDPSFFSENNRVSDLTW